MIDWTMPAERIHNQVRGLSPYPAAFTTIRDSNGKEYTAKIFETAMTGNSAIDLAPGQVISDGRQMWIKAADRLLEIRSLQPAGKKRMDTKAYLLGYHPESTIK